MWKFGGAEKRKKKNGREENERWSAAVWVFGGRCRHVGRRENAEKKGRMEMEEGGWGGGREMGVDPPWELEAKKLKREKNHKRKKMEEMREVEGDVGSMGVVWGMGEGRWRREEREKKENRKREKREKKEKK